MHLGLRVISTLALLLLLTTSTAGASERISSEQQLFVDALQTLSYDEIDQILLEVQEFQLRNPEVSLEQVNSHVRTLVLQQVQKPLRSTREHEQQDSGVQSTFEADTMIPTYFKELNWLEIQYCGTNPYYCLKTYSYAQTAITTAQRYYSGTSLADGKGDAFRHAYWNVLMVRGTSITWAKNFAAAHEVGEPGNLNTPAFQMDVYNNAQGQYIGQTAPKTRTNSQLEADVNSYVKNGKLMIIKSGKVVRSNQ